MGPHTRQTREHIVVACEFDLHLRVGRLRTLGEYLKNKAGPVDYGAALDDLLDIALLHSCEFIIEYYIRDGVFLAVCGYFFEFSASDVGSVVGSVHSLDKLPVALGPGGLCQELELVEVLFNPPLVVTGADYTYEYSFFCQYYLSWKITGKV